MDSISANSISLNHAQILTEATKSLPSQSAAKAPEETVFTASNHSSPSAIPSIKVTLSPAASQLAHDYKTTSRFASMEEQSEHKTRIVSTWVTLEELETGIRRPPASAEDARLSHLTMKELMEEELQLPRVDKNGHLQSGFAGTEQGDRISVAKANILLEARYNLRKTATNVEASVDKFKKHIEKEFNVDPDSYDIIFKNGKITVVSKGFDGADDTSLQKIQKMLDNPEKIKVAVALTRDIESFNEASWQIIDHQLTQYIHGVQQNRYLPDEVSVDWLMDGMNYSHASVSGQTHSKYLSIMAGAREKYHVALKDGTHFANGTTDPGILELTKIRQLQNKDV